MPPTRAALLALPLLLTAALAADDKKKAPAKPSDAVTRAWRKAGLDLGWYGASKTGLPKFKSEHAGLTGVVPAFWPAAPAKFKSLKKLPDAKVPFALNLGDTPVNDAGLKDVGGLKSLTTLYLTRTKV